MAELNINTNLSVAVTPEIQAPKVQAPVVTERPEVQTPEPAREASEAVREPRQDLENLVSVSEDGDTVQVSEEANEAYEDDAFGKVVVKDDQPTQNQMEIASTAVNIEPVYIDFSVEEPEPIADVQDVVAVTSYAGYSDSQLELMYREGQISRYSYEHEIATREERRGALAEEGSEFSTEMTGRAAELDENQRTMEEIEGLYSGSTSADVLAAQTRAEILAQLQDFPLNN
jgi:hypothetical protein